MWNQAGSSLSYNPHSSVSGAADPASATKTTHYQKLGQKTLPSGQKSPAWLCHTTSAAVWSLNFPSQQCTEPQHGKRKRQALLMLACCRWLTSAAAALCKLNKLTEPWFVLWYGDNNGKKIKCCQGLIFLPVWIRVRIAITWVFISCVYNEPIDTADFRTAAKFQFHSSTFWCLVFASAIS